MASYELDRHLFFVECDFCENTKIFFAEGQRKLLRGLDPS